MLFLELEDKLVNNSKTTYQHFKVKPKNKTFLVFRKVYIFVNRKFIKKKR